MKFSNAILALASIVGGSATNFALADAGDQPISESFITVSLLNPSDADADFSSQEQQFISMAVVKAFHKTHDHTDVLDLAGVNFEGQSHQPALGAGKSGALRSSMSYVYDHSKFFPMWHCRNGWCPEFIETFVVDSATLTQHGGSCGPKCTPDDDELVEETIVKKGVKGIKGSKEVTMVSTESASPHAAWEKKLCKILKKSSFAVFENVKQCTIAFEDAATLKQHGGSCGPKCTPDDDELVEEPIVKKGVKGIKGQKEVSSSQHGGSCGPKCTPDDDELEEEPIVEVAEEVSSSQHGGSCGPKCTPDDDELDADELDVEEPIVEEVAELIVEEVKELIAEKGVKGVKGLKQHGGSCGPKCTPDDDELEVEEPIVEEVAETIVEEVAELIAEKGVKGVKGLKQHGGSCGPKCTPDDDELDEEVAEPVVEEVAEPIVEKGVKGVKGLGQHGGSCGPKCTPDDDEELDVEDA